MALCRGAPIIKHMVVNNIKNDAKIKQKPVALKLIKTKMGYHMYCLINKQECHVRSITRGIYLVADIKAQISSEKNKLKAPVLSSCASQSETLIVF